MRRNAGDQPCQAIGFGLGRTGCTSLAAALEQLGFGPCYTAARLANPSSIPLWNHALDGTPDWEAIYQGCNAACDHPTAFFYRALTSQYSQAKFILTTRDPERWYVSASATILSEKVQQDLERSPIAPMIRKMHARLPGLYSRDKDQVLDAFRTHSADVRRYVSADRLLIFQAGDGWEPLCNFLGVACPTTEYPHANEGKDFQDEWKSPFQG
ncbi:MAG TPA: sulfotransferase [Bryobacteraceae bacterium]|nr:sulfotransferase [Bryobacteraceae bacterium]